MDYKKRYEEAQKWIESIYTELSHERQMEAEAFFPEFKESEDDKVRKELFAVINDLVLPDEQLVRFNTWLEKQGEKSTIIDIDKMVKEYSQTKDGDFGFPVNCMIRAYRQGINDALRLSLNLEKQDNKGKFIKEDATKDKVVKYLKNLITDQSLRGAPMLNYEGRIEAEADLIICIAKKELEKEKQGEQKEIDYDEEIKKCKANPLYFFDKYVKIKLKEQKPTDKVKSKFKVGDWIVLYNNHRSIYQIEKIENYQYIIRHILGGSMPLSFALENNIKLWTIDDAKDGDVLVCPKYAGDIIPIIFIFKEIKIKNNDVFCYCSFLETFKRAGYVASADPIDTDFYPATKEQRDLLFQKMKEAGYEWDAEKKELRKIEKKSVEENNGNIEKTSFNWSEVDENMAERLSGWLDALVNYIHYDALVSLDLRRERIQQVEKVKTWLKSLKEKQKSS